MADSIRLSGIVSIRDPLWDTILLDPIAVAIVDSPSFQRLRYIHQLGLAHLVYPGATHTRFDHALGVYHLARRALAVLGASGGLARVGEAERRLVPLAALLHDIGHYPFSHALEELERARIPGDHEAVVGRFLTEPPVRTALEGVAPDAARRIEALIRGRSASPLQGLVSGSLDLDKIEYLKRDARFCGVPYGEVDVDRLLYALAVVEDPETGRLEMGVREKGVAALESLLFAKYQMFRNVYWHHAVRAATVMYKRIVGDALEVGLLEPGELLGQTDEALLFLIEERARQAPDSRRKHGDAPDGGRRAVEARAGGKGGVEPSESPAAPEQGMRSRTAASSEAARHGDVYPPPIGPDASLDSLPARDSVSVVQQIALRVARLRARQLPKRVAEVVAAELDHGPVGAWVADDSPLKRRVEDRLAVELGLEPGAAFLDYPVKEAMFGLNLLVELRSGQVLRVGPGGRTGLIGLPRIAAELYQSARVLRLFVLGGRPAVEPAALARLVRQDANKLAGHLEGTNPLLG